MMNFYDELDEETKAHLTTAARDINAAFGTNMADAETIFNTITFDSGSISSIFESANNALIQIHMVRAKPYSIVFVVLLLVILVVVFS